MYDRKGFAAGAVLMTLSGAFAGLAYIMMHTAATTGQGIVTVLTVFLAALLAGGGVILLWEATHG